MSSLKRGAAPLVQLARVSRWLLSSGVAGWLVHPSLAQSLADEERQGGYTSKSEASQGCGSIVSVAVNDGKGAIRTEL